VSALAAAQAPARPARASLVVTRSDGAQDCPDAEALAERVRTIAGANVIGVGVSAGSLDAPVEQARAETWVQVALIRNFAGFAAQISTSGRRHGTRTLEDLGPSCGNLADAVAVTIAMFLDPYENSPAPTKVPDRVAPAVLAKPKGQAVTGTARARRFYLDGAGGIAFNLLEHSEPFLEVGAGFRASARWALALGGTFVFPDSKLDGTRSVDLRLSFAWLRACARALGDDERASLAWCAAPQLGSLTGSGQGYQNNFSRHALWFALAIGPEVAFRFTSSLSWLLSGQAVVPLLEQGFNVESDGVQNSAYRTPSVAGMISLGLRGHL